MIEALAENQFKNLKLKSIDEAKKLGQFFTSEKVASFMASIVQTENKDIRILDAGAGAGILTVAAVLRCIELGVNKINARLYEIDKLILGELRSNMDTLVNKANALGVVFDYEIVEKDFVLHRADLNDSPYDISIINPPYFKYNSKTSVYADRTKDLYKGNPNIYASFMAIALGALKENGQLIAIIPRSFTNGLYFKGFRHYLLFNFSLDRIHLFRSRKSLFKNQNVLQENIICSFSRKEQSKYIDISTSNNYDDLDLTKIDNFHCRKIIDLSSDNMFIRIPEDSLDSDVLDTVDSWKYSFDNNGYVISTGPVVEFRMKDIINSNHNKKNQVPLLKMHNVRSFRTIWDLKESKNKYIELNGKSTNLVNRNLSCLLLKRFSSKEEKRRLVAGILNTEELGFELVGIENHLNYIYHKNEKLCMSELYGLAVLFNSTFFDRYFRCISGNTQVNATEIRAMKLPGRKFIKELGNKYCANKSNEQFAIDKLLEEQLKCGSLL